MFPDTQENFLPDIFSLSSTTQHTPRKADHPREVPAHQLSCRALVASANTTHKFLIRIAHGFEASSEKRSTPQGKVFRIEQLFTFINPDATFAES